MGIDGFIGDDPRPAGLEVAAVDPPRLARWWAEALGYRILDERPGVVVVGTIEGRCALRFARADPVARRAPIELDVAVADPELALERLVNMGARPASETPGAAGRWADPEGNPFTLRPRGALDERSPTAVERGGPAILGA